MDSEDTKRWLDYQERGIKPSRYKLKAIVYADKSIKKEVSFGLNGLNVKLIPLEKKFPRLPPVGDYMPAFICEVISESVVHREGNNFDIKQSLDRILPWFGFDYQLPTSFREWQEYDEKWFETTFNFPGIFPLITYPDVPNKNIHLIVESCNKLEKISDKRSVKALKIRNNLKEAIKLESISRRYSFLSYYNIIEIISDDLSLDENCLLECTISKKKVGLYERQRNQKTKISYLLKVFENNFIEEKCIHLADIRNKLAHSRQEIAQHDFTLCKNLSFWAAENYVITLAKNYISDL